MKTTLRSLALAWTAVAVAACGSTQPPPEPSARPSAKGITLHFELANPDATDIPRLMAMDSLRAQGYTVETLSYADNTLLFVGMQRGDVDLASVADVVGWNAIHSGAPAFVLMDESNMTLLLLATGGVRACADMDGKPVAIGAVNGAADRLMHRYVENVCPGTKPQYVVLGGAANRLAALLSGSLAATSMELYDYLEMPKAQAAKVHVLTWFADEFPGLSSISIFLRRGLAETHPDTARDIVRAILQARRRIQDPEALTAELTKYLHLDPANARTTAQTYLARRIWDVNGAYTMDSLQKKIEFYGGSDAVPEGLKARDVADLSYLDAVLAEIGRR